jgi:hypothetical protein
VNGVVADVSGTVGETDRVQVARRVEDEAG